MIIIGCDYHPGVQQIAWVDSDTGEFQETRLQHREPAEKFYRELAMRGVQVPLSRRFSVRRADCWARVKAKQSAAKS